MPPEGVKVNYTDGLWKVTESNVIIGMVTLSHEDGRTVRLPKTQFERIDNRWSIKEVRSEK
jgi:hypothetical protein